MECGTGKGADPGTGGVRRTGRAGRGDRHVSGREEAGDGGGGDGGRAFRPRHVRQAALGICASDLGPPL